MPDKDDPKPAQGMLLDVARTIGSTLGNAAARAGIVRGLHIRLLRLGIHAGARSLKVKRVVSIFSNRPDRAEIAGVSVKRSGIEVELTFRFSRARSCAHVKNRGSLPTELGSETAFDNVEAINGRWNDDSALSSGKRIGQGNAVDDVSDLRVFAAHVLLAGRALLGSTQGSERARRFETV